MFCFNTKSKRYAIGNIEYPKEEYMNIKSKIIKQLADELEETKKLDKNVYNIGRAKV